MEPDRPIVGLTIEETKEYAALVAMPMVDLLKNGRFEVYLNYVKIISAACSKRRH